MFSGDADNKEEENEEEGWEIRKKMSFSLRVEDTKEEDRT